MTSLLHALQKLDTAIRLYGMARDNARALEQPGGQPVHGWRDFLQTGGELWRSGGGSAALQAVDAAREVFEPGGEVVEAEYRVLEDPPWAGFLKRLLRQRSSSHIILGPTGSGKTSLALKLAHRFAEARGYRVEACNLYAEDRPDFAATISVDTLVARMARLAAHLASLAEDEDEAAEAHQPPLIPPPPRGLPPTERVVILDEAVLAMSSSASDPGRRAALQALAQSRHLSYHVLYIGQLAGQLPLGLLGQSTVWVKEPAGREARTDRDHPVVRDLWERAASAFAGLRTSPWFVAPWRDPRCWAYVDCQSLNGEPGYEGLVPFQRLADAASP